MYFELLTHARNRWTGANIGDAAIGLSPALSLLPHRPL